MFRMIQTNRTAQICTIFFISSLVIRLLFCLSNCWYIANQQSTLCTHICSVFTITSRSRYRFHMFSAMCSIAAFSYSTSWWLDDCLVPLFLLFRIIICHLFCFISNRCCCCAVCSFARHQYNLFICNVKNVLMLSWFFYYVKCCRINWDENPNECNEWKSRIILYTYIGVQWTLPYYM